MAAQSGGRQNPAELSPADRIREIKRIRQMIGELVARIELLEQSDRTYTAYAQRTLRSGQKRLPLDVFYQLASELIQLRRGGGTVTVRARQIERLLGLAAEAEAATRSPEASSPANSNADEFGLSSRLPRSSDPTAEDSHRASSRRDRRLKEEIVKHVETARQRIGADDAAGCLEEIGTAIEQASLMVNGRPSVVEQIGDVLELLSAVDYLLHPEQQRQLGELCRRAKAL